MSSTSQKFSKSPLYYTIPLSLLLHVGLYSLGFRLPDLPEAPHSPTFDVTMVLPQNSKAPEKADFIANANQLGSGNKKEKSRIESKFASTQQNYNTGADLADAEKSIAEITPKIDPQVLTTKGITDKTIKKLPEKEPQEEPITAVTKTSEKTEAIAQLIAEMSIQEEHFAKRPRIHFINSLNTKGTIEAEYIYNWSKKLERIGNINFPQKAIDLSLSGTLILNATLDPKGNVVEIQVAVSSGSKILDDAAVRIVKLAAPYDHLPQKILEKYERLNITRTMVFHKPEGDSAVFSSK